MKRNDFTIAVDEFKLEETEKSVSIAPELFKQSQSDDLKIHAPVELHMKLIKFGHDFNIRGRLSTKLGFDCSRCLESYDADISVTFNNIYTRIKTVIDLDNDLDPADLEMSIIEGDFIDLRELVYEQLILQIPIKPLCRDDCKGLCPVCGQDLNQAECGCHKDANDPRFALLKKLINQKDGSNDNSEN